MGDAHRFFLERAPGPDGTAVLGGEEFKHFAQVLRHRSGDRVILLFEGQELNARVAEVLKGEALLRVEGSRPCPNEPGLALDLFAAVCRGDKTELAVQKAVELGVSRIVPFFSQYTVAGANPNRAARLNRVADEAVKQCGRARRVTVEPEADFDSVVRRVANYDAAVLFYECERQRSAREVFSALGEAKRMAVIVGSEGGFSPEEAARLVAAGARSAGLGRRILRAETAAAVAVAIAMYEHGELQ